MTPTVNAIPPLTGKRGAANAALGGFSLVELLVAMFILLLITLMTGRIFLSSTRAVDTGTNKAEMNLLARAVPDLIEKDLQQSVFNSTSNATRFISLKVTGSTITFSTTDPTNWSISADCEQEIVYAFSGGTLSRDGTELLTSSNIVGCTFSSDDAKDPSYIEVSMDLQSTEDINRGNPQTSSYKTRIFLDNFDRFRFEN